MQARKWIIPLVLVSALIFVLSFRQLSDPDLGFHLKYGRWITENHRVPVTDLSTYTVKDHAYTDLHWLFQVKLFLVYRMAGYPGISIFVTLLAILLSLLLILRTRALSVPIPVTVVLLMAGFLVIEPRIAPRPEMFTFLFLTATLLILDLYTEHHRNYLYLLPVIMLVWCNMHGLFVLGPVSIATYIASRWIREKKADRTILLSFALSVGACFLNPYGIRGVAFPLELLTRFDPTNVYNQHIQEFMPFFRQAGFFTRDWLFLALATVAVLFTVLTWQRRKLHEPLLLLIFGVLAFASIRNIPLFVLAAVPVIGREAAELQTRIKKTAPALSMTAYAVAVLVPLLVIPRLLTNNYYLSNNSFNKTGTGLNLSHQPVEAAAFIAQYYPGEHILNSIGFGGWLSWVLPQPVFIDGRLEVMQEQLYSEITDSWNGGLPQLVSRYRPRLIVYNYLIYYPWTYQLKEMDGWRLVYVDGKAAVFSSDTAFKKIPSVDLTALPSPEMTGPGRLPGNWFRGFRVPADYAFLDSVHMAHFRMQMLQPGRESRRHPEAVACFNTANQKYRQGDVQGALSSYDSAVALDPAYAKAYNNRGILKAEAFKDFQGALTDFNRAISIDSIYGDAFLCRGTTRLFMGDSTEACRDWKHALSLGNSQAGSLIRMHCKGK